LAALRGTFAWWTALPILLAVPGAAYAAQPAAVEPMLMTWPRLRATMPGSTARVTVIKPLTLASTMSSQSSSDASCAGATFTPLLVFGRIKVE